MVTPLTDWWGRLGLQLKLQLLIQGGLIVILIIAQQWVSTQFEHQIISAAEERAKAIADGAINGLNTLMVTKIGKDDVISDQSSRALFIQKMGVSEKVKELRVIRSKAVEKEFDRGLPQEQPLDEIDRSVLASGKTESRISINGEGDASIRTVMPFIAMTNFRTTNCLKCHGVNEGEVLGAASVIVDIKDDIETSTKIKMWLWAGQGVVQIVLFFVIRLIVRRLLRQLGGEPSYVIEIVKRIAQGNLSGVIVTRPGDDNSLLAAMTQMQSGLRTIVGHTLRTAEQLAQSARQLVASAHQVSGASDAQSDASASVAASVEEMTVCISEISDSAAHAQKDGSEAGLLAKGGSQAVSEVIVEMGRISEAVMGSSQSVTLLGEKSQQISNIVKVINEIAEQTNLLALNAAIEAARAGEQGRGFAVVADEVRKLAERTMTSTQEVATMIQLIQDGTSEVVKGMSHESVRVNQGVALVGHANESMERIQGGVQKVLASVEQISSALREQNAASNLIARSVEGIAEMTEKNSSVIKEVSSAAEHLEQLAVQLNESVGKFKL